MAIKRRTILQALPLGAGVAQAQNTEASGEALGAVARFDGVDLSPERLAVVRPVLEGRAAKLKALRDFVVDDSVSPR